MCEQIEITFHLHLKSFQNMNVKSNSNKRYFMEIIICIEIWEESEIQEVFFKRFIYSFDRVTKGEIEIFHLPVHFLDGFNGQHWDKPKMGARSVMWVSYVGAGAEALGPSSAAFSRPRAGSWIRHRVAGTWMGFQYCRRELYCYATRLDLQQHSYYGFLILQELA